MVDSDPVDPARRSALTRLVGEARALEPAERDAYLSEACAGDDALRREVEWILAAGNDTLPDAPDGPTLVESRQVAADVDGALFAAETAADGTVPDVPTVVERSDDDATLVSRAAGGGSPAVRPETLDRSVLYELGEDIGSGVRLRRAADEGDDGGETGGAERYRERRHLGEGGMGVVTLVEDRDLKRQVAMKVNRHRGDRALAGRFVAEAQILAQLEHPNIVPLYELGVAADRTTYCTMRYVQGRTLGDVIDGIKRGDPGATGEYTTTRLVQVFQQIVQAVSYAHDRGVVHRDLKPHNVMLGAHGEVQVLDWGMAKLLDRAEVATRGRMFERAGQVVGTPAYMSPEQATGGDVDERSDIFALGIILYELLTLERPFAGRTSKEMTSSITTVEPRAPRAAAPARDVPSDLEYICLKALAKDRAVRYQTAEELGRDVALYLEGRPVSARAASLGYVLGLALRRHRALATTVAAALVVILVGSAVFIQRVTEARDAAEAERQVAEASARRARAKALTLESAKSLGDGLALRALLLAREAVATERDTATVQAVRDALGAPIPQRIIPCTDWVNDVDFSADGELLLVVCAHGARVFNRAGDVVTEIAAPDCSLRAGALLDTGDRIVTACEGDDGIELWDRSGRLIVAVGGSGEFYLSPAGDRLLIRRKGRLELLDADGRAVASVAAVERATGEVGFAGFTANGAMFAAFSADGHVQLYDRDGTRLGRAVRVGATAGVLLSPDGRYFVTEHEREERIWSPDGRQLGRFEGFARRISPDGSHILARRPSPSRRYAVHDRAGKLLAELAGNDEGQFSPDGGRLIFGSTTGASVFDLQGRMLATLGGHGQPVKVAFSPDGATVATAGGNHVRVWPTDSHEPVIMHHGLSAVLRGQFAPDGRSVVTSSVAESVRLWGLDGSPLRHMDHPGEDKSREALAFDGQMVVSGFRSGTVQLWDLASETPVRFRGHEGLVHQVAMSPDGRVIVTASERDDTARLWDRSGEAVATLRGHERPVNVVSFAPDGALVLTGSEDGTARLWDLAGNERAVLRGHTDGVASASMSPDGRWVLTAAVDGSARLFGVDGRHRLTVKHGGARINAKFMPDGSGFVTWSVGDRVRLWDLTGKELLALPAYASGFACAIAPDGQTFATTDWGGTVYLWRRDGSRQAVLRGHAQVIRTLEFSPDGSRLLTASNDGTARLWRVDDDEILEIARELSMRGFTEEEQTLYGELLEPGSRGESQDGGTRP
jgi:WD40 repeat protein/tRNA A-37 threonylcarbamoyl transferase component Bud32